MEQNIVSRYRQSQRTNKHLTGLTILSKVSNLAPTIYLEDYFKEYQNGSTMADICQEIICVYEKNKVVDDFDVQSVTDFMIAKEKVCYKIVNAKRNREMLMGVPHIMIHDLAVVFYILVGNKTDGTNACVSSVILQNVFTLTECLL